MGSTFVQDLDELGSGSADIFGEADGQIVMSGEPPSCFDCLWSELISNRRYIGFFLGLCRFVHEICKVFQLYSIHKKSSLRPICSLDHPFLQIH